MLKQRKRGRPKIDPRLRRTTPVRFKLSAVEIARLDAVVAAMSADVGHRLSRGDVARHLTLERCEQVKGSPDA